MVTWFGPQNQAGYGLLVPPQNRRGDEDGVGHASRSSGLLHLEASRARVSQSGLKLVEARHGWCMWHHHRRCMELKLKMDGSIRGCLRLFYPSFVIFIILDPKGILVI
jgi:hypothetical protein